MYFTIVPTKNDLQHHGILGMKWGVRRYQNKDGSLTAAGKKRYSAKDEQDAALKSTRYFVEGADEDLNDVKAMSKGNYGAYRSYVSKILTGDDIEYQDSKAKANGFKDFEDYVYQVHDKYDMRKDFQGLFSKKDSNGKTPMERMLKDAQAYSDTYHAIYDRIEKMPVMNMTHDEAVNEIARIRKEERSKQR